jgi:hypothetical protein
MEYKQRKNLNYPVIFLASFTEARTRLGGNRESHETSWKDT